MCTYAGIYACIVTYNMSVFMYVYMNVYEHRAGHRPTKF